MWVKVFIVNYEEIIYKFEVKAYINEVQILE